MSARFAFAFEPRFRPLLALAGVTPSRAFVELEHGRMTARFGPWTCACDLSNVRETCVTGPYHWYKAIGARGSFVDRGLTFGSTTEGGVCMLFHEPVTGLDPLGRMRHPGLTVTVADRDGFVRVLRDASGLAPLT